MGDVEAGTVCRVEADTGGTWRKGEFVQWADLFIFVEAMLVWLGLLVVAMSMVIGALAVRDHNQAQLTANLTALFQSSTFHYALTISLYIVLLFFFWRIAKRVAEGSLAARFRTVPWSTLLVAALIGMVLAVVVPVVISYLVHSNAIDVKPTKNEVLMMPHSISDWLVALFAVGVMAPLAEELYFRGILLGWLKARMPIVAAVPANAAIFGLIHFSFLTHPGSGGWFITGILMLVGLITAILAVRTRSLWASFAVHSGYNSILVTLPLLQLISR